jgi:predicted nucleic acid-binding protein
MPLNLDVFADVVDLRTDKPKTQDKLLVDTNVWYWLSYSRAQQGANQPLAYQLRDYPRYINQATITKSSLYYCGLSFAELAHRIEVKEHEIFQTGQANPVKLKEFRHNFILTERPKVIQEIISVWQQVEQFGKSLDFSINTVNLANTLQRLTTDPKENRLDGYDLFFLETMFSNNITNIITDDSDFLTVNGITVFTANYNAIQTAKAQGKLKVR